MPKKPIRKTTVKVKKRPIKKHPPKKTTDRKPRRDGTQSKRVHYFGGGSSVSPAATLSDASKHGSNPLWSGPETTGITFSLLCKFLECRERFRLLVVEGIKDDIGFNKYLEFGSLWHEAEESFSGGNDWKRAVRKYSDSIKEHYPADEKEINELTRLVMVEFPLYISYWKTHNVERRRKPILEEGTFSVPYQLPSGRVVNLLGKFDAVFLLGKKSVYLQENKTKGERRIDSQGITHTIHGHLQSMLYQIALREAINGNGLVYDKDGKRHPALDRLIGLKDKGTKVKGTLYNVVMRALSDRYAIRRKKQETDRDFYRRVKEHIKKRKDTHFQRWKVEIYNADINKFRRRSFDPILEQLWNWWESIQSDPFNPWITYRRDKDGKIDGPVIPNHLHYQSPWGVYNSLADGFRGSYFDYLTTGSELGLTEIETLFPELDIKP